MIPQRPTACLKRNNLSEIGRQNNPVRGRPGR